jgi:hypothetical protein
MLRACLLAVVLVASSTFSAFAAPEAAPESLPPGFVVVEQVPPPPVAEEEPPPPPDRPFSERRVRVGFTFFGGPTVPSGRGDAGGFGGASFRIGAQLDRTFSVYYQGMAVVGGYAIADDTSSYANVFAGVYNSVLGGLTLADHIDLGFGPSLDSIASVSASASDDGTATVETLAGTTFGLHARIAVLMGFMHLHDRRRSAFAFSIDLHPTFIDGRVLFTTAFGLGGEWY